MPSPFILSLHLGVNRCSGPIQCYLVAGRLRGLTGYHGCRLAASGFDQLLAAVDVVGSACEGSVRHKVNGECGDIFGTDDAANRQPRAELLAPFVESVA